MTDEMRVCLIDDDDAVLDSLRLILSRRQMDVHCFKSAEELIEAVDRGMTPDCIVTDVRMPKMSGLELQEELKRRGLDLPLILITGHGDIDMAVRAIKGGAFDFIEKPFDDKRLVASVREAIKTADERQAARQEVTAIADRIAELSDRQRQVMDLAVQGYSNKEIAARLGISPRTVDIYRAWVMKKTGARNLAELVRMAMKFDMRSGS